MLKYINILLLLFIPGILFSQETLINLSFSQPKELKINAGTDFTIGEGESITLGNNLTISGGTPEYSYLWKSDINEIGITPTIDVSVSGQYTVEIRDSRNCTASDIIYVLNTSVSPVDENSTARIHPNPVEKNLNITLSPDNLITQVDILSVKGEVMISVPLTFSSNTLSVNLENLEQGMYFALIKTQKSDFLESFVLLKETK